MQSNIKAMWPTKPAGLSSDAFALRRLLEPGELFRHQRRPEKRYLYKTVGSHMPICGKLYSNASAST